MTNPKIYGRIIDGVDAKIEHYPYQVSLHRNGAYICGGSIIGGKIILTAAHCTLFHSGISVSVRYGSSFVNQGGAIIEVSMLYEHVRYNPQTNDYDISLLRLDRNMQLLSPQAEIVNLVPSKTPEGGRSAEVTGWGCIEESGPTSEKLQVLEVQEVDRDACNKVRANFSKFNP
ncbi:hypothetical protein RI129_013141 [Pyrocoelia pectoralis]|uniref:Peptidase S1 domain-containing protein n=1 Tax=Pyrocoelia pectoralis TaxID=417401 RepID=A0AAN7V4C4_9COLE